MKVKILCIAALVALSTSVQAATVDDLLSGYQQAGAGKFSASGGESGWHRKAMAAKSPRERSCSDCHGKDLTQTGKHVKTGKRIKPMAVSVNAERLSDPKKVEKWFKRNCKWTFGRECTPQEKGDFLLYISGQ